MASNNTLISSRKEGKNSTGNILNERQTAGLQFLIAKYFKKTAGVVINDLSGSSRHQQIILFLDLISGVMVKPVLVVCHNCSIMKWIQQFKSSKYFNDVSINSLDTNSSKVIVCNCLPRIYQRVTWGVVIVDSNETIMKRMSADFKIWITSNDLMENPLDLATIYRWIFHEDCRIVPKALPGTRLRPNAWSQPDWLMRQFVLREDYLSVESSETPEATSSIVNHTNPFNTNVSTSDEDEEINVDVVSNEDEIVTTPSVQIDNFLSDDIETGSNGTSVEFQSDNTYDLSHVLDDFEEDSSNMLDLDDSSYSSPERTRVVNTPEPQQPSKIQCLRERSCYINTMASNSSNQNYKKSCFYYDEHETQCNKENIRKRKLSDDTYFTFENKKPQDVRVNIVFNTNIDVECNLHDLSVKNKRNALVEGIPNRSIPENRH